MKLGLHFTNFALPGGAEELAPTLAATARATDEGGFAAFTRIDHWVQMEELGTAHAPMLGPVGITPPR